MGPTGHSQSAAFLSPPQGPAVPALERGCTIQMRQDSEAAGFERKQRIREPGLGLAP